MLLGKRPRPQMKRTASVSGITVDLSHVESEQQPSDDHNPGNGEIPPVIGSQSLDTDLMNYTLSFVSPRGRRNLSAFNKVTDHGPSSVHFLRTCTFCHRRLSPACDIYMYMGDTAFCSAECRERKMEQYEKEKDAAAATDRGGYPRKERSDCGSGSKGF